MSEASEPLSLKPLDLSNMLKHAFAAGRLSNEHPVEMMDDAWVNYDPTENAAYQRVLAVLMAFNEAREFRAAPTVKPLTEDQLEDLLCNILYEDIYADRGDVVGIDEAIRRILSALK